MAHAEERTLDVHLVVRCEFDEDYEGDRDGYAWADEMPAITQDVLRAVVNALRLRPGWKLRGASRGRSPEDEVMLVLEKTFNAGE